MYSVPSSQATQRLPRGQVWLKALLKYQILTSAIGSLLSYITFIASVSHDEIFKVEDIYLVIFVFIMRFLPINIVYALGFGVALWWYFRTRNTFTRDTFTSIAFITTLLVAIPVSLLFYKLWYEDLLFPWNMSHLIIVVVVQIVFNVLYLPRTLFRPI